MARDSFLLRTDPQTLNALRRWADDELRSVNAQIEYLLRRALRDAGRLEKAASPTESPNQEAGNQASGSKPEAKQVDAPPKSDNPS